MFLGWGSKGFQRFCHREIGAEPPLRPGHREDQSFLMPEGDDKDQMQVAESAGECTEERRLSLLRSACVRTSFQPALSEVLLSLLSPVCCLEKRYTLRSLWRGLHRRSYIA